MKVKSRLQLLPDDDYAALHHRLAFTLSWEALGLELVLCAGLMPLAAMNLRRGDFNSTRDYAAARGKQIPIPAHVAYKLGHMLSHWPEDKSLGELVAAESHTDPYSGIHALKSHLKALCANLYRGRHYTLNDLRNHFALSLPPDTKQFHSPWIKAVRRRAALETS